MMLATLVAGPRSTSRPRSASCSAVGNSPGASPSSAASRPSTVRAAETEICWPIIVRNRASSASSEPGRRMPGVARTSGAKVGSADSASSMARESASRSRNRRTRETRVERSARVASCTVHRTASDPSSVSSRSAMPPGRRTSRRKLAASPVSTPAMAWSAKNRMRPAPSKGARAGSRSCTVPELVEGPSRTLRRPRSSLGVVSYTAWMVSLNCLILENPAANATSATGRSVATSSVRAV